MRQPAQPRAHAHVETLVRPRQGRVREGSSARLGAQQHPADVRAQHIVVAVVLTLVELAIGEADGASEARHA